MTSYYVCVYYHRVRGWCRTIIDTKENTLRRVHECILAGYSAHCEDAALSASVGLPEGPPDNLVDGITSQSDQNFSRAWLAAKG